jgi:hypothetical protein
VDTAVSTGDTLQVFGTLGSGQTIQTQTVVVVPAVNYAYMYTVSALAGLYLSTDPWPSLLTGAVSGWPCVEPRRQPRRTPTSAREEE